MTGIPTSVRELLATGPLVHVTTLDPDGTPHVTLAWAGFEGEEVVMATFFNLGQRKLQNLRREYWTEDEVNQKLDKNITKAFLDIYHTHEEYGVNMRKASMVLAVNRVVEATKTRGLWP